MAGIDACSHEFIFRQLPIRRSLSRLETRLHLCHIQEPEKLFYRSAFVSIGLKKKINSLHRLRSAGATAAAAACLNDRVECMGGENQIKPKTATLKKKIAIRCQFQNIWAFGTYISSPVPILSFEI